MIPDSPINISSEAWWYKGGMVLSIIILMLGSFVTYAIPIVALNFQYFNLVEREESKGLLTEIEQLNTEN